MRSRSASRSSSRSMGSTSPALRLRASAIFCSLGALLDNLAFVAEELRGVVLERTSQGEFDPKVGIGEELDRGNIPQYTKDKIVKNVGRGQWQLKSASELKKEGADLLPSPSA